MQVARGGLLLILYVIQYFQNCYFPPPCVLVLFQFTLERNAGHAPHSPQLAAVRSLYASKRRPDYKAPTKTSSEH